MHPTSIEPVTIDDLSYEVSLAKRFTDAIGFLPREALDYYAVQGGVLRARENGDPAGFVVFTRGKQSAPREAQIYQAAIQMDAQRRHHGLALIQHAAQLCHAAGAHIIRCWCASDLEANQFWEAAGFRHCGFRDGGKRRGRRHILWQLPLSDRAAQILEFEAMREAASSQVLPLFTL